MSKLHNYGVIVLTFLLILMVLCPLLIILNEHLTKGIGWFLLPRYT